MPGPIDKKPSDQVSGKPWDRKNPHQGSKQKMTEAQIAEARARAEKAGRRYPNLIDNMAVMKKGRINPEDLP